MVETGKDFAHRRMCRGTGKATASRCSWKVGMRRENERLDETFAEVFLVWPLLERKEQSELVCTPTNRDRGRQEMRFGTLISCVD